MASRTDVMYLASKRKPGFLEYRLWSIIPRLTLKSSTFSQPCLWLTHHGHCTLSSRSLEVTGCALLLSAVSWQALSFQGLAQVAARLRLMSCSCHGGWGETRCRGRGTGGTIQPPRPADLFYFLRTCWQPELATWVPAFLNGRALRQPKQQRWCWWRCVFGFEPWILGGSAGELPLCRCASWGSEKHLALGFSTAACLTGIMAAKVVNALSPSLCLGRSCVWNHLCHISRTSCSVCDFSNVFPNSHKHTGTRTHAGSYIYLC